MRIPTGGHFPLTLGRWRSQWMLFPYRSRLRCMVAQGSRRRRNVRLPIIAVIGTVVLIKFRVLRFSVSQPDQYLSERSAYSREWSMGHTGAAMEAGGNGPSSSAGLKTESELAQPNDSKSACMWRNFLQNALHRDSLWLVSLDCMLRGP